MGDHSLFIFYHLRDALLIKSLANWENMQRWKCWHIEIFQHFCLVCYRYGISRTVSIIWICIQLYWLSSKVISFNAPYNFIDYFCRIYSNYIYLILIDDNNWTLWKSIADNVWYSYYMIKYGIAFLCTFNFYWITYLFMYFYLDYCHHTVVCGYVWKWFP